MIARELLDGTIGELASRIRKRELSPVALTEAYLERSATIGKRLNAYATLMPERALAEAREAEREIAAGRYRGVLHGIPYAAKDLLAAKGAPTSWGAKPYEGQTFDYDAHVIRKLREAGAVLLGKAAMIELAGGMGYRYGTASISGGAKNPWDERCWTCGSSSGSGAIVAAALAAFAIGTETWGSIVCPSTQAAQEPHTQKVVIAEMIGAINAQRSTRSAISQAWSSACHAERRTKERGVHRGAVRRPMSNGWLRARARSASTAAARMRAISSPRPAVALPRIW